MQCAAVHHDVKSLLEQYVNVVPANNEEFNDHYERVHPRRPYDCPSPLYGCGRYNQWRDVWSEEDAELTKARINTIIATYYD